MIEEQNYFYLNQEEDMPRKIMFLEQINWHRSAKEWQLRAIGPNGRIIANKKAAILISNVIKSQMGIALTKEEQHAENALLKSM